MPDPAAAVDENAIRRRIEEVRERVEQACQRAGRDASEVTLIGVSKTFALRYVDAAREADLRDFAENRVQDLEEKAEQLPGAHAGGPVNWHFVGHLQRNKVKTAIKYCDTFHALDSPRLARELEKRLERIDRTLPVFVQVNVSGEESKYGLPPSRLHEYLDSLAEYDHLRVRGLMTIASLVDDPEEVRPEFRLLRDLYDRYDDHDNPSVELEALSMGMTNDFEVAIEEGATHLRVGRAIFGPRDA